MHFWPSMVLNIPYLQVAPWVDERTRAGLEALARINPHRGDSMMQKLIAMCALAAAMVIGCGGSNDSASEGESMDHMQSIVNQAAAEAASKPAE